MSQDRGRASQPVARQLSLDLTAASWCGLCGDPLAEPGYCRECEEARRGLRWCLESLGTWRNIVDRSPSHRLIMGGCMLGGIDRYYELLALLEGMVQQVLDGRLGIPPGDPEDVRVSRRRPLDWVAGIMLLVARLRPRNPPPDDPSEGQAAPDEPVQVQALAA